MTLTQITTCAATSCAFNHNGCSAAAVTIVGGAGAASCGTFTALDARGGLPTSDGHVGACQRLECAHNRDLMCSIDAISIGADSANCEMYEVSA